MPHRALPLLTRLRLAWHVLTGTPSAPRPATDAARIRANFLRVATSVGVRTGLMKAAAIASAAGAVDVAVAIEAQCEVERATSQDDRSEGSPEGGAA